MNHELIYQKTKIAWFVSKVVVGTLTCTFKVQTCACSHNKTNPLQLHLVGLHQFTRRHENECVPKQFQIMMMFSKYYFDMLTFKF